MAAVILMLSPLSIHNWRNSSTSPYSLFMEQVAVKPEWMQDDGLHPNGDAQPFIADWMAQQLKPLVVDPK